MKAAQEKLKEALLECLHIEQQNLEKEMVGMEEHIFSDDFIEKMAKLGIIEND